MPKESQSVFSGALYEPPSPDLPILAALFKDGALIGSRAVRSHAEGQGYIDRAVVELPTLEDQEDT